MKASIIIITSWLITTICPAQYTLADTEFWDGMVFISSETHGNSWSYKFTEKDYELWIYNHYDAPARYLCEEGSYTFTTDSLVLSPNKRRVCEIEGLQLGIRYVCDIYPGDEKVLFVSVDTLSPKEVVNFEMQKRVCPVYYVEDKLMFNDPSKVFNQFRQMIK